MGINVNELENLIDRIKMDPRWNEKQYKVWNKNHKFKECRNRVDSNSKVINESSFC